MNLGIFLLFSFFLFSCSQNEVTKVSGKKEDGLKQMTFSWTKKSESDWTKEYGFKKQDVGFILFDPQKKKVLKSAEANQAFTPASVMKILTANYTLWKYPPDHRFVTTIKSDGELKGDVFTGDLYLVGGGDPLLMSNHLMELCVNLRTKIKTLKGNFYFDESLFTPQLAIENSQADEDSYNAPLSPLSSDFNLFQFHYRYNTSDNSLEYFYFPDGGQKFSLARSRDGGSWDALDLDHTQWLVPMLKGSGKENLPLRQAGLATAMKLQNFCGKLGLILPSPIAKITPDKAPIWSHHRSIPLTEIITLGMEYSNNLVFESLLLYTSGKSTLSEAASSMANFYKEKIKVIEESKIQMVNGSGLSHENKLSPHYLLEVLKLWGDEALSFMPISGVKGTLGHRLFEPPMSMSTWAKTGTMDYVSSLAGTLFTKKGKKLQFVIMVNNKSNLTFSKDTFKDKAKKLQDDLVELWWHEN
ncbi:MAG: D-alanyl-D-alanine carboxypeptidase/D-alanyl-D-alanine-endopeptidase [Bacteriovoracaceae bacterium]